MGHLERHQNIPVENYGVFDRDFPMSKNCLAEEIIEKSYVTARQVDKIESMVVSGSLSRW